MGKDPEPMKPCPTCGGTGGDDTYTCSTCSGEGYVPK